MCFQSSAARKNRSKAWAKISACSWRLTKIDSSVVKTSARFADIDHPQRLQCVDHSTRADRNPGGSQRAGKADDVVGDQAGGGRGS